MSPDEQHKIYTMGFLAGQEHQRSAPETSRRLHKLEVAVSILFLIAAVMGALVLFSNL